VNHLPAATPGTLRERFVEDMTVRGFTDKTRHDYIRTVAGFAAFLERSPSTATAEDIRRFQIHQSERGMNAPAMNSAVAVEFHRGLTREARTFPLRFDPCSNRPPAACSGGSWSDRHGVIGCDPALGFTG
jgi:hypothetical protein